MSVTGVIIEGCFLKKAVKKTQMTHLLSIYANKASISPQFEA